MIKKTIGYDETKKMLNTLRNLNESKSKQNTLREQSEVNNQGEEQNTSQNIKNDILVINDVEVKLLSSDSMDMQLTDEQKNSISNTIDGFKQQVTNLVDLTPGLTINTNQIRLDGHVTELDFKFTLVAGEESGLYLISNMTEVNQQLLDLMTKLNKFYQTFIDSMNKLIDERKNN
jgi:hypothetical protein